MLTQLEMCLHHFSLAMSTEIYYFTGPLIVLENTVYFHNDRLATTVTRRCKAGTYILTPINDVLLKKHYKKS
jgi:hypothetical protein